MRPSFAELEFVRMSEEFEIQGTYHWQQIYKKTWQCLGNGAKLFVKELSGAYIEEPTAFLAYANSKYLGKFPTLELAQNRACYAHEHPPVKEEPTMAEAAAKSAKKAKATEAPAKEAKPKTVSGYPELSTIVFLKDSEGKEYGSDNNPKRKGSAAAKLFSIYKAGMTLADFLKKGGTRSAIKYDVEHKFISVKAP